MIFKYRILRMFLFILLLFSAIFISCGEKSIQLKYPVLTSPPVIEYYFGKKIIDKYRVLEYFNNNNVQHWLNIEKRITDSVLSTISNRAALQKQLEKFYYASNVKANLPRTANQKIFFLRKYLKEKVEKIYLKDSLQGKEIELFSTETLNTKDSIYNIDYYNPSFDGLYLALGISCNGNENSTIYVFDVRRKLLLRDHIKRAMGGNPNWIVGKSAFFYQQFKDDSETKYEDSKVKLHFIGTDPKDDKEIFSRTHNKNLLLEKVDFPLIYTYPSSNKVLAVVNHGAQAYATLYYTFADSLMNSDNRNNWKKICDYDDKIKNYSIDGDNLFLLSYRNNPKGLLEKRNLKNIEQKEILLIGEDEILDDMIQNKNSIFVKITQNGINKLKRINLHTLEAYDIKLPYTGAIDLKPYWEVVPTYIHSDNLYLGLTSWTKEWSIYCINDKDSAIETNLRPHGYFKNIPELLVKETEAKSYDGTLVPLSIIYSKKTKLDGRNPTILYAYGAYGASLTPEFNSSLLPWFLNGGIYAVAHVRGGGEKGDNWYRGGYKETKPNSWKDFIACAEYLIQNRYTSASKLAAEGGSAGSITIGRALTEKPDLFKAAIISVGVPNTIRFEKTSNTVNISEFGTIKDSIEFQSLYEMDTYHHIKENTVYPSILFTAGINDARVDIWQPAKAVAAFQNISKGNIVLFSISENGHFGDNDYIKELTDKYSFLFWQLGHSSFTSP